MTSTTTAPATKAASPDDPKADPKADPKTKPLPEGFAIVPPAGVEIWQSNVYTVYTKAQQAAGDTMGQRVQVYGPDDGSNLALAQSLFDPADLISIVPGVTMSHGYAKAAGSQPSNGGKHPDNPSDQPPVKPAESDSEPAHTKKK